MAFGNAEWFCLFPRSQLQYLERLGSDHRPIFLSMTTHNQIRKGRFIFDKKWSSQPAVTDIIKKHWRPVDRSAGKDVSSVISSCRKDKAKWKKSDEGNSKKQIHKLRRDLEVEEQKRFPNLGLMNDMKLQLHKLYQEEEIFWKYKYKNTWLVAGDLNTKFFHGWAKLRKMKNLIAALVD